MTQLFSLCSGALEPQLLSPWSTTTEAEKAPRETHTRHLESNPCLQQLGKARAQQQKPAQPKNGLLNLKITYANVSEDRGCWYVS